MTGKVFKSSPFLYFKRKNKRLENSADLPCRGYFCLTVYLHVILLRSLISRLYVCCLSVCPIFR
jgi:hypothetical protein